MGWDAWAILKRDFRAKDIIIDSELREKFAGAVNSTKAESGGDCDGWLDAGGLDASMSGEMLFKAVKTDFIYDGYWNKRKVLSLYKKANWNFEYAPELKWAYLSAKAFLQVCAENNLSIKFDS